MTWNASDKTSYIVLSNSDKTIALSEYLTSGEIRSKHGLSSGKWYVEFAFESFADSGQYVGFSTSSHTLGSYVGNDIYSWGFHLIRGSGAGTAYYDGSGVSHSFRTLGENATVRMALDLDNKKVWYSVSSSWDGDPTDPVSGGFAHSFTGMNSIVYLTARLVWNSGGWSICTGKFSATEQQFSAPSGYSPIGDGWPAEYVFESALFELTGEMTDFYGGLYPVYEYLDTADFAVNGQPVQLSEYVYADPKVQLDHARSDDALILQRGAERLLLAYCHPDQYTRGASGYINQLLTSGKWYLEIGASSVGEFIEHPYDAVRCGLIRGTESLNRMLGDEKSDDTYMVSLGAYNSAMRYYRAGLWTAFTYAPYNAIKGLAIDLTDPTDGRMWVHNDGTWLNGTPTTKTGGISLVGSWYLAVSVKNNFVVNIGGDNAYIPMGFTRLDTQNQWVTSGLWGGNSVVVDVAATLTVTQVDLRVLVGNHLLRSSVWKKKNTYYLGLLTSMEPLVEVQKTVGGYQRQPIYTNDSAWTEQFFNTGYISFPSFSGTIVGWALFWYHDRNPGQSDPVVYSGSFSAPLTLTEEQPGLDVTPHSFSWTMN